MANVKDSDGNLVKEGDRVFSSYGIPPLRIEGEVVDRGGVLWVLTPGHSPPEITLKRFKEYLGPFWRI